jgi:hypothetical protein
VSVPGIIIQEELESCLKRVKRIYDMFEAEQKHRDGDNGPFTNTYASNLQTLNTKLAAFELSCLDTLSYGKGAIQ